METTTLTRLEKVLPESETHWRSIASRAHRLRGATGDEAAARTHDLHIREIREARCSGSSRAIRFCPRCLANGNKYALLFIGAADRCGTCNWPAGRQDMPLRIL